MVTECGLEKGEDKTWKQREGDGRRTHTHTHTFINWVAYMIILQGSGLSKTGLSEKLRHPSERFQMLGESWSDSQNLHLWPMEMCFPIYR